jgi:SAM-dependent methyltransferase
MLHHLDDPGRAVAEASRVLQPGGWYFASASSRFNDPELVTAYPTTKFDAEEAEDVVGRVVPIVEVVRWDAPLTVLEDRAALERYCVHHLLDASIADRVATPLTLTKRGCLVVARKPIT